MKENALAFVIVHCRWIRPTRDTIKQTHHFTLRLYGNELFDQNAKRIGVDFADFIKFPT